MQQLLPDVYLVEGLRAAQAYLLTSEGGHTLVDAGTPGESNRIQAEIEDGGFSLSDVKVIVLTHAHNDHMGSAAELARRAGAGVLAHEAEVPFVEGTAPLPFTALHKRAFSWLGDRVFSAEPCTVARALQDGDPVYALGGLQVVHAPGHTPGSMALYQPERQILLLGDIFFHRQEGLGLPPGIVSVDLDLAAASARQVASLPAEAALFGHGPPILEGAGERLRDAVSG